MKYLNLNQDIYDYLCDISLREHPVLRELREETAKMALAIMQIPPEQAQFMQMLIRLTRAKNILEIGTFTGYSALAMSLALPDEGRVSTCDRNPEWTEQTSYYWGKANQSHKITLHLAPALSTLNRFLEEGLAHTFDFIFIDADKTNYCHYYELSLKLLTPGGLILIDNIFWEGDVINTTINNAQTREIRKLNASLKSDDRVHISLLPIADGLFLVQSKY